MLGAGLNPQSNRCVRTIQTPMATLLILKPGWSWCRVTKAAGTADLLSERPQAHGLHLVGVQRVQHFLQQCHLYLALSSQSPLTAPPLFAGNNGGVLSPKVHSVQKHVHTSTSTFRLPRTLSCFYVHFYTSTLAFTLMYFLSPQSLLPSLPEYTRPEHVCLRVLDKPRQMPSCLPMAPPEEASLKHRKNTR